MLYANLDKQKVLEELSPLTCALYHLLPEYATKKVIPFFGNEGREIDESLATHILRYEVRRALKQNGIDIYGDDGENTPPVDLKKLHLSGIEGVFLGWRFKVLRSRDDEVPPPGRSETRMRYYSQAEQLPLPGFEYNPPRPDQQINVVILWDCDSAYRDFQLRVALPKEPSSAYGQVDCYFNVEAPHIHQQGLISHIVDDLLFDQPKELDLTTKSVDVEAMGLHQGGPEGLYSSE